jgi:hypothetical protein
MSVIAEFTIDQFWEAEDQYTKMLDRMKRRAREIAIEFGKVNENWFVKDIELVCVDDEMEVLLNTTLVNNRNAIDKARGVDEERVEFQFPMDWLFYEDYKESIREMNAAEEKQRGEEYQEYLRLKAKFES